MRLDAAVSTVALAAVLALGACGADAEPTPPPGGPGTPSAVTPTTPAPTEEPAPAPTAVRDVPVRSADLADQNAAPVVEPARLRVPAIDVDIPVEPVGVQTDGQMEIPPMAEVGGWYRFGASPADEAGTAVVAAHVDSVASEGLGPFARLRDLAPGDTVEVDLADGPTRAYAVVDVTRVPKPTVEWDDVFVRGGAHRLVLVTCGGTFRPQERSYSDNVIVTAEPLP